MNIEALQQGVEAAMSRLQKKLRKTLEDQGHVNTGRLRDSIKYEIEVKTGAVVARMESLDYGLVMEFGIPAGRIPYGGRTGRGGRSKYIQGLITYFESKGLQGREAIGAAFATANVHRREGLPTVASRRFSNTGERTGFVKSSIEQDLGTIAAVIEQTTGHYVQLEFGDVFRMEPIVFYT